MPTDGSENYYAARKGLTRLSPVDKKVNTLVEGWFSDQLNASVE